MLQCYASDRRPLRETYYGRCGIGILSAALTYPDSLCSLHSRQHGIDGSLTVTPASDHLAGLLQQPLSLLSICSVRSSCLCTVALSISSSRSCVNIGSTVRRHCRPVLCTMSLDSAQLTQALRALYTYITRKSSASSTSTSTSQLFDDDQFIYLQISLKRTPNRSTTKPYPLPLPHPLYTSDTELCLITKDPPRIKEHPTALSTTTAPNAIKQYFTTHPVSGLNRIIGVTKLRKEYARFKERRELLALYDLFLADDRILPLLPAVLGVKFFDKKRQPIPVDLTRSAKEKSIHAALHSTYMYIPTGSSLQVKVGRSSMSRQQVHDNVMAVIGRLVGRLPAKWKGVQMVGVKCGDSITIPVYQSLPLQAIREDAVEEVSGEVEAQGEDEEEVAMDGVGDEHDQPEEAEAIKTPVSKAVAAGKKRKRNDAEKESKTPQAVNAAEPTAATPVKTPLAKTPQLPRTATPRQSNGASAGKRVAAMLLRAEEDEEDEDDELEVTLHPDLLDDEEDEEVQPTRTPTQSNKKAKQTNGTAANTPSKLITAATPGKATRTPATAKGRASTAPTTPTAATERSTDKKRQRVEEEKKETAEVPTPRTAQRTPNSVKLKSAPVSTPMSTPRRKRAADESKEAQQEADATPVAKKTNLTASKTPATTRTGSKASKAAVDAEEEELEEHKPVARLRSTAKKAVSGRLSLPANVGIEKSVQTKKAPASARKSKA